jgi:hypothetical protein
MPPRLPLAHVLFDLTGPVPLTEGILMDGFDDRLNV